MVSSTYNTGSWIGIVRSGSVIALDQDTDPAIVHHLWDYLGQDPTIHGVLNEVTEAFGTGLTGMPAFAILMRRDRLHAILRGDMDLVASSDDGIDTVSGRDVTTWSERSLPLPYAFELTLAEAGEEEDQAASVLSLPVSEAVVRFQSLTMGADEYGSDFTDDQFIDDQFVGAEFADEEPSVAVFNDGLALLVPLDATPDYASYDSANAGDGAHDDGVDDGDAPGDPAAGDGADAVDGADAEDDDEDAYAEFAMAAEAADAEWNAQLAPVARLEAELAGEIAAAEEPLDDRIGLHGPESDLDLTIGPYADGEAADEKAAEVPEEQDPGQEQGLEQDPGQENPGQEQGPDQGSESPAQELDPGTGEGEAAPSAEDAVDDGFTINYDFLFGATVAQSVEAAAVRLETDPEQLEQGVVEAVMPPKPTLPPLAGNVGAGKGSPAETAQESSTDGTPEAPFTEPEPEPSADGLMIDSVPWASHEQAEPTAAAGVPTSEAPAVARAGLTPSDAAYDPDHDGHTVMRSDFHTTQEAAAPLESRPPTGPMVLARMCPNGHANPPSRATCWNCATNINAEPREVGRPRLGTMHISSGEVVELDHSLIIGRQPSVSRVMGGAMPRLVQVRSGNGDISRSHVEVRLDGWDVLLVDLKATNGTVLVREGQAPRRLNQGEEAILLNGDIAELGDGVSLLFDGLL